MSPLRQCVGKTLGCPIKQRKKSASSASGAAFISRARNFGGTGSVVPDRSAGERPVKRWSLDRQEGARRGCEEGARRGCEEGARRVREGGARGGKEVASGLRVRQHSGDAGARLLTADQVMGQRSTAADLRRASVASAVVRSIAVAVPRWAVVRLWGQA